jgi:transglutaminase-like putative cysteine protease
MKTRTLLLDGSAILAGFALPARALDSPAYATSIDARVIVNVDLTATIESTVRQKILRESAIPLLGQRNLFFAESIDSIEIIEAFTEKPDGRRLVIDAAKILTRDAASGLNAVYRRDSKVTTLIFPDIEVGDTLVHVARTYRHDKRMPGHFFFSAVLSRSVPYSAYHLAIDAPKSVELRVHATGDGLTHVSHEIDEGQRHVFNYEAKSWIPEEPGAVSPWDRDPQLVITTFKSMAELAAGYWSNMGGKDIVTPEIQALADEITKGIESRRGQAAAIDHWVKKNIRYVLVYLGSGGMTPNPAPLVLKNKYGDCKDHVALTAALLKAKGIASEQALISMSSMYRLPEVPAPLFNHVMLYLPELGLYTDPTASSAAFGVLPMASYDKPVLHISDAGGRPARTPPMKSEDHVATSRTTVTVAADGSIKGETHLIATGVFAAFARQTASRIETQGREKYAEDRLRALGQPGTGIFEPAKPSDFSEPFSVHGSFLLNDKLHMPLVGLRDMPIGMPIYKRPGFWPFGQRIANRKSDFSCFAVKEVEEIEVTFSDGLPMPKVLKGDAIDIKYFSYRSSYDVDGRVLRIRREFTSKVAGQVCLKDTEVEIAHALKRVARSLATKMVFGDGPPAAL